MRPSIIFICAFLPLFLFAQSQSSIGVHTSLDFTNLVSRKGETIIDYDSKPNFRAGFSFNYALKKQLFLKTGLCFASMGYQYESGLLVYESDFAPGSVTIDPPKLDQSLPRSVKFTHDHYFLEIPLMLRYEWQKEGLSPFIEAGLSPNIYLKTRGTHKTNLDASKQVRYYQEPSGFRDIQLAASLGLGMQKYINQRLQFYVQSVLRVYVTPVSKVSTLHFASAGVELGLRRFLKK